MCVPAFVLIITLFAHIFTLRVAFMFTLRPIIENYVSYLVLLSCAALRSLPCATCPDNCLNASHFRFHLQQVLVIFASSQFAAFVISNFVISYYYILHLCYLFNFHKKPPNFFIQLLCIHNAIEFGMEIS